MGTKERIEACGMREFLKKGFNGASLRHIVREAGVTTGAFYKHYPTKAALFESLVGPCVQYIYRMFDENYAAFVSQDLADQTRNMNENSDRLTAELLPYIYDHHDAIKLVLTASEGTPYADFAHQLARREERSTLAYAELIRENGVDVPELDAEFVHMVSSGLFAAAFEIILHDMDQEAAYRRIRMLERFYAAGWGRILGVSFSG